MCIRDSVLAVPLPFDSSLCRGQLAKVCDRKRSVKWLIETPRAKRSRAAATRPRQRSAVGSLPFIHGVVVVVGLVREAPAHGPVRVVRGRRPSLGGLVRRDGRAGLARARGAGAEARRVVGVAVEGAVALVDADLDDRRAARRRPPARRVDAVPRGAGAGVPEPGARPAVDAAAVRGARERAVLDVAAARRVVGPEIRAVVEAARVEGVVVAAVPADGDGAAGLPARRREERVGLRREALGRPGDPLLALRPRRRDCLLYTSPSPRDKRQSRMPSSA